MSRAASPAPPPFRLDVHPGAAAREMVADVRAGLSARPKVLPPKYFYDARGSELYERITELPEYYQARAEAEILARVSGGLIRRHRPEELVEIGSGSSRKTEAILEVMAGRGGVRYLPFDVCAEMLLSAGERLVDRFRGLDLHGVAGDFNLHMDRVPAPAGRRMVAFLGGTVGNLDGDERSVFMRRLARLLAPGDLLLLGTDLQGDAERIRVAYDDAEGVTAEFNRNVLHVLNRELGGDVDVEAFRHVARYDHALHRVEMRLRATRPLRVRYEALEMDVEFAAGEDLLTEISCKFTRNGVADTCAAAGLRLLEWHEDREGRFALSLAVRPDDG